MSWTKYFDWLYKPAYDKLKTLDDESQSAIDQRNNLNQQGQESADFANRGQDNFAGLGVEAFDQREKLRRLAEGQDSYSKEALRQGLQQNVAAQRSMAASASPANAAMAARTAAVNAGRMGYGMSGQAALAGIQERKAAQEALANMIMQQRQQELQAALQGRQNAISGYGGSKPEGSWLDKWGQPVADVTSAVIKSDRRAKTEIADAEDKATKAAEALKAYTYRYKDAADGKGQQFGIMAQELEKAGLGSAVIDTPTGKHVDAGKLSTANTAMISALARRVAKIEGGK